MTRKNFKEKKGVLLIFEQFRSRCHLSKLDRLTPQDVYCVRSTYNLRTLPFSLRFSAIARFTYGSEQGCGGRINVSDSTSVHIQRYK